MSAALVVALLAVVWCEAPVPSATTAPTATAVRASTGRLKLGASLGRPGLPVQDLMTPRFADAVDVWGKAPPDFNQTMAVWWDHFDITTPAIYGRGTAFRQPPPPGSVDIIPLVEWAVKKVKDRKRE